MQYQNLIETTFIEQVDFHQTIDSTNSRAMQLAATDEFRLPLLVIAEKQTAGRGRGANRWWSGDGALMFSLLLDLSTWKLSQARQPQISLIVGLAIAQSLCCIDEQLSVGLKWPNDIFIEGQKVCGILTEVPAKKPDRVVIGVGLNVNNTFRDAPKEIQQIGTSLADRLKRTFELELLLENLIVELQSTFELFKNGRLALTKSWHSFCILKGRQVEINAGSQQFRGICHGIDDDGALLLHDGEHVHRCFGGVVTSY